MSAAGGHAIGSGAGAGAGRMEGWHSIAWLHGTPAAISSTRGHCIVSGEANQEKLEKNNQAIIMTVSHGWGRTVGKL